MGGPCIPQMLANWNRFFNFPLAGSEYTQRGTYDKIQDSGIESPSTVPSLVGLDKGIIENSVEGEDLTGQSVFAKVSCYSVGGSARIIVAGEGNAPAVDCMQ